MIIHDECSNAVEVDEGVHQRGVGGRLYLECHGAEEGASFPNHAFYPDASIHALYELLGDRQAESASSVLPCG